MRVGRPFNGSVPVRATAAPATATATRNRLPGTLLPADAHRRDGLLRCATGIPIARVTALMVTSRVPEPARSALGITPCGHLLSPQQDVTSRTPLGHALRGLGISREQLGAAATPGQPG
jgi:hypothetical protein